MSDEWLVLSLKWSRGAESLVWYRPRAQGYTTDIDKAGRYSEAEAKAHEYPDTTMAVHQSVASRFAQRSVPNEGSILRAMRDADPAAVAVPPRGFQL